MSKLREIHLQQVDYQGLFFEHLVRQQFTWFNHQHATHSGELETKLASRLQDAMQKSVQNPAHLLFVRLTLGEQLPNMIDLVMDHAGTADEMRKTINNESWLAKELLQWINSSRFRKRSISHDHVDSLDKAMDLFGGKLLAYNLLEFAISQAAAREMPYCKLLNRRILEWAQEQAQFAGALAQKKNVCEASARMAALVQSIAPLAISQNFVHLFERQMDMALTQARECGNKKTYDQLLSIKPPVRVLLNQLVNCTDLQNQLLSSLGNTGHELSVLSRESEMDIPTSQLGELAKAVRQARRYSQYRWLNDACVLTPEQSHQLLFELDLTEDELSELTLLRRR